MVIVTGGSGFIGTAFCRRLKSHGRHFRIVDLVESLAFPHDCIRLDICDSDRLSQSIGGDTIVHLAAEHRDDVRPVEKYASVNVDGTANLCRAAELRGVRRIVFTSSVAVYGFCEPDTPEEGRINWFNEYGRTKYLAEEVLREWQARSPGERTLVIVRPTVVFGPGNRGNVFNLFEKIASRRFLMIGSGENSKSLAYVENVAAFLEHAIAMEPGVHVFNYADKPDLRVRDLVLLARETLLDKTDAGFRIPCWLGMSLGYAGDLLAMTTGGSFSISSIRVRKFLAETTYSSKAHLSHGFTAPFSIRDAIVHTLKEEFMVSKETKLNFPGN